MATIKDVARLAKVSVATVSRVINNASNVSEIARQSVRDAMKTLNYHPNANARALSQQTTNTIGIIVADVSDPFFGAMVTAVEKVAFRTNNFLLIGNGYHNEQKERKAIEQMISHRCESLVVHAKMLSDEELSEWMRQVPGMVLINRILIGFEERCIALNDRYGAYLATRHIIQNGHKNIGYLCSDRQISDKVDRLQGYKDALTEFNISFNEMNVAAANPSELGGEQAMMTLLERNLDFTAIVSYNDLMAAGAMSVLYDNDIKIPSQVSLIGFDDVAVARYLYPKLTTMRYPVETMAQQAAELALALTLNLPAPNTTTHLFVPTLIKRHSVQELTE